MTNKQNVLREKMRKKITSYGNSAHIPFPKKYEGMTADITIYEELFYCKECKELISGKSLSETPDLCKQCEAEKKAIKENKCIDCGGPNPKEDQWSKCDKCYEEFKNHLERPPISDNLLNKKKGGDKKVK